MLSVQQFLAGASTVLRGRCSAASEQLPCCNADYLQVLDALLKVTYESDFSSHFATPSAKCRSNLPNRAGDCEQTSGLEASPSRGLEERHIFPRAQT